jgi:hypothetical protein
MSSLAALRNSARTALVNTAIRMAPRTAAAPQFRVAPALWSRSFASGGFLPKEEVSSRVLDVVKNFQNVDPAKVTATSHFINDLGLDSLDTVEVCALPTGLRGPEGRRPQPKHPCCLRVSIIPIEGALPPGCRAPAEVFQFQSVSAASTGFACCPWADGMWAEQPQQRTQGACW